MFLGHLSRLGIQPIIFDVIHGSDNQNQSYAGDYQYHDEQAGLTILGNVYLIERNALLEKLGMRDPKSDLVLVLHAYQKWGVNCLKHLAGFFIFSIWDNQKKELFVATDHNGTRPCFYAFSPSRYFYVSDSFRAITHSLDSLTINHNMFVHFVLDSLPDNETCYKEIVKLPAAHYLLVGQKKFKLKCYWRLSDTHLTLPYKTREDFYGAFREIFTRSVNDCLGFETRVAAHISGGLDSSSIACVAAQLLSTQNQTLYGFTALPRNLAGPSYRDHWQYHEMPIVQDILNQYPNIQHHCYFSDPKINVYDALSQFYADIDQPFWCVFNLDWMIGSLKYAADNDCRILLNGRKGNATISWWGHSRRERVTNILKYIQNFWGASNHLHHYSAWLTPLFLQSKIAKKILASKVAHVNEHYWMLTRPTFWQRNSSIHPLAAHYGVNILDPTGTLPILQFCYHIPEWVYHRPGGNRLNHRLLAREGLSSLVSESVRTNPHRGEQAADWHLTYNHHRANWSQQLQQLSTETREMLWALYDKDSIMSLIKSQTPISLLSKDIVHHYRLILARCLSLGFFYESLVTRNNGRLPFNKAAGQDGL